MSTCHQCRSISVSGLSSNDGYLLHESLNSLNRSAATCDLCHLIGSRIEQAAEDARAEALAIYHAPKDGFVIDGNTAISLVYSPMIKDADDIAAEKVGKPRRNRTNPTEFTSLDVHLRFPRQAEWKPAVMPSLLVYVHPGSYAAIPQSQA